MEHFQDRHLDEEHEFYKEDGRLSKFAGTMTEEEHEKMTAK